MNEHPVLTKIDRNGPYFERSIVWRRDGRDQECRLQLWLPVQLDNGGWVAAVHLTGLNLPTISKMPGDDALGALVSALAFARDAMERAGGRFLFGRHEMAGLPVSLDRGFRPEVLLGLETQANRLADEAAVERDGLLSSKP